MALIKYYNLVSHSWDTVSELELDLQKRLLSEKQLQRELSVSVDKAVEARANGDADTLNLMVYDSGEFDILYKKTNEISAKKIIKTGWFKEDITIPEKVNVELVVKATIEDLLQLQDYLQSTKFDVVEARAVSQATFAFATIPSHSGHTESYQTILNDILRERYSVFKSNVSMQKDVSWDKDVGATLIGLVSGPVEDILQFRMILNHSSATCGARLKYLSVSFS